MLLQLHNIRSLQTLVLNDDSLPLNQRATIAKAVTDSLNKMAELQNEVYSSERFKKVENTLIRALVRLPESASEQFLADYRSLLSEMGRK